MEECQELFLYNDVRDKIEISYGLLDARVKPVFLIYYTFRGSIILKIIFFFPLQLQ